jgi:hypothetical protein
MLLLLMSKASRLHPPLAARHANALYDFEDTQTRLDSKSCFMMHPGIESPHL